MSDKNLFIKVGKIFIAITTLCISFNCVADFEPYPGKHQVRLISADDYGTANVYTEKGKELLVQHVIEGYNQDLMPPKGGCRNCSEDEIRAAVDYILLTSGVIVKVN
jgi:hypothetical protein